MEKYNGFTFAHQRGTPKVEQPELVKRIGKTTYTVNVHFNPNSKETMSYKIILMLHNGVRNM